MLRKLAGQAYAGDELETHGNMCVNAKGNGKIRSKVILWPRNGFANEIWVYEPGGEYVLKANGAKLCPAIRDDRPGHAGLQPNR